jgi:hypothetical protein
VTGEHATEAREPDADATRDRRTSVEGRLSVERPVVVGAGLLALLAVAARETVRMLVNLPFDPAVVPPTVRSAVATGTPLVVGGALVAVALADERPTVRVGLLFAGVFGPIGLLGPAAVLPATVAVAGGAALALSGTLGRPDRLTYRGLRRRALAVGFVATIAVSLADGVGLVTGAHGVGALLALASLAAVGTRAEGSVLAVGVGLLVAAVVVYVSVVSPYVVGTALLVVFAVTGVPNVLVALAVAGGVAAGVAGLIRRSYPLAIGAGLLVLAGVPVTLPRATTVLFGAALVVLEWDRQEVSA